MRCLVDLGSEVHALFQEKLTQVNPRREMVRGVLLAIRSTVKGAREILKPRYITAKGLDDITH